MASYTAPIRDTRFAIQDVVQIDRHRDLPGYDKMDPDLVDAILEQAGLFAEREIVPLNEIGDREGPTWRPDGSVAMPRGWKEGRRKFTEAGFASLTLPEEIGGQGMPELLQFVIGEYLIAAGSAFNMHSGFGNGAIDLLRACASPEQQQTYVPRIASGEWSTTMNLTEPASGSDLTLMRSRAVPQPDGSYAITGTKIFISGGEHDLTDNIIHLVLARLPDAPPGNRGISMFLVPKILVNEDGSLGARNSVVCTGIEHKMGLRGSPTCTMSYEGASGWLVGEENKGLAGMFILMNSARLSVGIQGLGIADAAYQNAARYALERRQGRAPGGPVDPDHPADLLFVHPDVRRMLMDAKAFTEAMRVLVIWLGLQLDLSRGAADPEERMRADDLLGLLTPVLKGYGTQVGFDITVAMQQVFGGHGYIVESGMEQYVRDLRIAMIYEGANGIQANDLVGRKIRLNGGRALAAFLALTDDEVSADMDARLTPLVDGLRRAVADLRSATDWLREHGADNPATIGSVAYHYLHLMGIATLSLMWVRSARAAIAALADETNNDRAFYEAKLVTAAYFTERFVPDTAALLAKIRTGSATLMALDAAQFERA